MVSQEECRSHGDREARRIEGIRSLSVSVSLCLMPSELGIELRNFIFSYIPIIIIIIFFVMGIELTTLQFPGRCLCH